MKPRLKILHTESSTGWGGQEIRIITEAQGMIKRNHHVMIAAPAKANIIKNAEKLGIPTAKIDFHRQKFFSGIRTIFHLIQKHKFDVVNTHSSRDSWVAGIAARLSKKPLLIVRTRHLSIPIGKSFFEKAVYRKIPYFIITTGEAIKSLIIKQLRFPEEKIESVPTGIDLKIFDPFRHYNDIRRNYRIPSSGFVICTVAVLRSWKGHQFLLEAAKQLCATRPNLWFLIVGSGNGWEEYNRWVKKHGLEKNIILTGYQNRVPEILHSTDLFVLPSYAKEGVPQSIIQAMAMKKAVITCDVGAIGDVVADGQTGRFVPPKDANALSKVIAELIDDTELVRKNFDIKIMLDKTENIYFNSLSALDKKYHKK
jgi:glycosyltransferase involved in cell wall biosynthesis